MYPQALSRVLAVQPVLDALERDQAQPRAPFAQLQVGQMVTAKVLSQTRDMTLVRIENHTVAMRLPRPAQDGETLKLSFAGHMPQPVFVLEASDAETSSVPQFSQTARMLSEIMQRVPERTPPTLTPAAPLLAHPPTDTAVLAPALHTALVRSGLFYESHLAAWAVGRDSLEGLMREPQNRLTADVGTPLATDPVQKSAHPLHTLLTQQLQVLESPQFVWRGEVWPGQTLEWQLRHDPDATGDAPSHDPAEEAEAPWESRLKLSLPTLGTVDVQIRLDARQAFSIRVVPADNEVLPLLKDQQGRLSERMEAAGCALRALEITQHAAA